MAGDVVDVLLRVDGRDLAAELLEALEDADRRLAMAGVVGSREADGPGADDRDVVDHAGRRASGEQPEPQPPPAPASTGASSPTPSFAWKEEPQPQAAWTFGLLIANPAPMSAST